MKRILFFLLFLPALLAHAQDGVLSDTSYIENRQGTFYNISVTTFESGRRLTDEAPLGSDTTEVINAIIGPAFTQFSQYATQVVAAQTQYARQRQTQRAVSASVMRLLGVSYFQAVSGLIENELLGTYQIRVNGAAPVQGEIIRLQSGALRYRQGGQNYVLDVFSRNWIRIRNLPGAPEMLDLFLSGDAYIDAGSLGVIRYRLLRR